MDFLSHPLVSREDNDGHSRGQRALVVTTVLTGLATLVVAMRLYARVGIMKIMGREDWAVLFALVGVLACELPEIAPI